MSPIHKILAIDTVTEGCSAALLVGEAVYGRFEVTPRGHTQHILPMVDQLLVEHSCKLGELDAIAFNRGPGSFTGLRITAGVVQGLAYGADVPVIPVSSLAALAYARYMTDGEQQILAAIDARMGEVYWGGYHIVDDLPVLQGEERVIPPQQLECVEGTWVGVGSGWKTYQEPLQHQFGGQLTSVDGEALPSAETVVRLALPELEQGRVLSAVEAQPLYLRNQVVHQKS